MQSALGENGLADDKTKRSKAIACIPMLGSICMLAHTWRRVGMIDAQKLVSGHEGGSVVCLTRVELKQQVLAHRRVNELLGQSQAPVSLAAVPDILGSCMELNTHCGVLSQKSRGCAEARTLLHAGSSHVCAYPGYLSTTLCVCSELTSCKNLEKSIPRTQSCLVHTGSAPSPGASLGRLPRQSVEPQWRGL